MQEKIHAIWGKNLALSEFSDEDDFFTLGGHSLIMARIQGDLTAEFGVEVPMDELFRNATVADITKHLQSVLPTA